MMAPLKTHRFVSVGRLSPEKGYLDLLKIFNRVQKKHPSWVLDIIGDGLERERLEQYIKKEERRNGGGYVYSGTSRQSTSNALGESASPKVGSSSSAPKSGFGSVGARSAAS